MDTQLKERIDTAIKLGNNVQHWGKQKDSTEFKEYNSLSVLLTGERLVAGCGNCAAEFLNYLKHITQEKINQTMSGQFTIGKDKNGNNRQIHCIDSNLILTDNNLTDELAIQLLRKNRKHISSFKTFPENWEELIGNTKETTTKETTNSKEGGNDSAGNEKPLSKKQQRELLMEMTAQDLRNLCVEMKLDKSQYTTKTKKPDLVELILAYTK